MVGSGFLFNFLCIVHDYNNYNNKTYLLHENKIKCNPYKVVAVVKKKAFYGINQSEAIPGNAV